MTMPYTLDEIREIIIPLAERYALKTVWVFGSYARGEATDQSDVDLLIDDTSCTEHGLDYFVMLEEIADRFAHGADVVSVRSLDATDTRRGQRRFRKTVLEERVKIYEAAA